MNVMQQYTWKTLRLNRQRTIVTIIGVILSAAMVTAVSVFLASFITLLQRSSIADNGNWHVLLRGVPADRMAQVRAADAVDLVVLKRDLGYAPLEGSQNSGKPYLFVRQLGGDGFAQMSIRLTEGRLPQSAGEIVLSETVNRTVSKPYQIGDTMSLSPGRRINGNGEDIEPSQGLIYRVDEETGQWINDPITGQPALDERLLTGEAQTYTVVGFIERPGLEPSWSAACSAFALLEEGAAGTVDVYYTAASVTRVLFGDAEALAAAVGAPKPEFNTGLLRYYGVVASDTLFTFLFGLSAVIFVIILVASVSMIGNAFAISVSERSRQLGILASVGATRAQKRASVYFEAALIYAAGMPLGILAGIGGIAVTLQLIQPLLLSIFNTSGGVTLDLVVPPLSLAAAVALSAVTLLLSARRPARIASRVQPIDAIRQSGDIRISGKSVRTGTLVRRLFGFEAEIAMKNLKRSRRKYRATIASLVISIVLFLTVSTYADTARLITAAGDEGINYDILVNYNYLPADRVQAMDERIAALDGIQAITRSEMFYASLPGDRVTDETRLANGILEEDQTMQALTVMVTRLDDGSFTAYTEDLGLDQAVLDGDVPGAILINAAKSTVSINGKLQKVMGSVLAVGRGDALELQNSEDLLRRDREQTGEVRSQKVSVAVLTDRRPMGVPLLDFSTVVIIVSDTGYERLAAALGIGPEAVSHRTFLEAPDDQRTETELSRIVESVPGSRVFLHNFSSYARSQRNLWVFLGVFVYGFITLISLICIANIFNTVSTNVALRRKEFAMLRSVGMTPSGFNRMIRFESVFYGLKSLLYGLPASVAVAYAIYRLQGPVVEAPFALPLGSYGFAIGLIFVIVFATMLYSSHRFKRENIIEALREENL